MLNIAVVGTGWWGTEFGKAAQRLPEKITIQGNFSIDPAMSQKWQQSFGGIRYDSVAAILDDDKVDAVLFATPHTTHRDLAVAAAEAGKHVFVEKPMTLDVKSGREVIAACDKAGVKLGVGHNRRFSDVCRKMKELIDTDALGQIIHVEANLSGNGAFRLKPGAWRADPNEVPNAGFTPMGIHMVDTFTWLLGPTERLVAVSKHQASPIENLDDTCAVLFELKSGQTGFVTSNSVTARSSMIRVFGTKGKFEANDNFTKLAIAIDGEDPQQITGEIEPSVGEELEAFAAAVAGAPYVMEPVEALRNVAFIEAIRKSVAANGWVPVEDVG